MRKRLEKVKIIKKVFTIQVLVCSLLFETMPYSVVHAQTVGADTAFQAGYQILDSVKNQFLQNIAQQRQYATMANVIGAVQPTTTQSKLFPHCRIPQAKSNEPINVCENPDPQELLLNDALDTMAEQYRLFYDKGKTEAQNTHFPAGLQCIVNARESVKKAMQDKLNALQLMIDRIKKNSQAFRDKHKAMQEQMRRTTVELDGGGELADEKSKDWKVMFGDPACNDVLNDALLNDQKTGLRAISGFFTKGSADGKSLRDSAVNTQKDIPVMQAQLQTQIQRIKTDINKVGLADWIQNPQPAAWNSGGLTKFKGIEEAIKLKQRDYELKMKRINEQLAPLAKQGLPLPPLDSNFQSNIANYKLSAKNYVKAKFVNECITLKDSGIGLTNDQLVASLQIQTKGGDSNLKRYQKALAEILAGRNIPSVTPNMPTPAEKLAAIKALDASYGNKIVAKFNDRQQKTVFVTAYSLLQDASNRCEAKFKQEQFNPNNPSSISAAADVDKALKYVNEAEQLYKTFSSDITQSIQDRIINCGGEGNEVSGKCDATKLDSSKDNFCMNTASRCAQNVMSCFQKANGLVRDREQKLKGLGDVYNKDMDQLIAGQEALLKSIKNQVGQDAQYFSSYFKGANFELPSDVFIKLPEMSIDPKYGVNLRGGGSLDFLEKDLPEQLDKMKEAMKEQGKKMDDAIARHLNEQKAAIAQNEAIWKGIGAKCKAMAKNIRENMGKQNIATAEGNKKIMGEVQEFCFKYEGLASADNPAAGCSGDNSPKSLYTAASKVAAFINPAVIDNIKQYKNMCAKSNNEGKFTGTEIADENPIADLCSGGTKNEDLAEQLLNQLTGALPSGINPGTLRDYVNGKGPDDLGKAVDPDFAKSGIGRQIKKIRDIAQNGKDGYEDNYPSNAQAQFEALSKEEQSADAKTLDNAYERYCKQNTKKEICRDDFFKNAVKNGNFSEVATLLNEGPCKKTNGKLPENCPQGILTSADGKKPSPGALTDKDKAALKALGDKYFQKEAGDKDKNQLCKLIKQEAAINAISACKDKHFESSCINSKKADQKKNPTGIAADLNSIVSLNKKIGKANISGWKSLGETAHVPCPRGNNSSIGAKIFNPLNPAAFDRSFGVPGQSY